LSSPAEPRPVYLGAEAIGVARSWLEVRDLLIERGLTERAARDAVLTRGLKTAKAFHIIAAGPVEQMLAAVRAVRAQRSPASNEAGASEGEKTRT
jgi:hypothetical protein